MRAGSRPLQMHQPTGARYGGRQLQNYRQQSHVSFRRHYGQDTRQPLLRKGFVQYFAATIRMDGDTIREHIAAQPDHHSNGQGRFQGIRMQACIGQDHRRTAAPVPEGGIGQAWGRHIQGVMPHVGGKGLLWHKLPICLQG